MDVLHHHLEAIEAPGLRNLHLGHETRGEVLEHDAVGGRKERQHIFDEMFLSVLKFVPIMFVT